MTLIGLQKQLKELKDFIVNFRHLKARVAVLWGACGVGKTSSVYYVADDLGYEVVEFNASDDRTYDFFVSRVKPACCSPSIVPTIVLLDEFEDVSWKAQRYFAKMMKKIVKPTILTTNDKSSIYTGILSKSIEIYYPKPSIEHIIKFAKQHGFEDFERIKDVRDYRQLKMIIEHSSDGAMAHLSQRERILDALRTGDYSKIEKNDLPIILDTVSEKLDGVQLWQFVECLRVFDTTGYDAALSGLKAKVDDVVNVFYEKINNIRRETK